MLILLLPARITSDSFVIEIIWSLSADIIPTDKYFFKAINKKQQINVLNILLNEFKVDNINTRTMSVDVFKVSILLTLDTFDTAFVTLI